MSPPFIHDRIPSSARPGSGFADQKRAGWSSKSSSPGERFAGRMKAGADSGLIETTGVGVDDEEPDAGFDGLLVQFADSGQRLGNRRDSSIASGDLNAVVGRRMRGRRLTINASCESVNAASTRFRESSEFVIDVE